MDSRKTDFEECFGCFDQANCRCSQNCSTNFFHECVAACKEIDCFDEKFKSKSPPRCSSASAEADCTAACNSDQVISKCSGEDTSCCCDCCELEGTARCQPADSTKSEARSQQHPQPSRSSLNLFAKVGSLFGFNKLDTSHTHFPIEDEQIRHHRDVMNPVLSIRKDGYMLPLMRVKCAAGQDNNCPSDPPSNRPSETAPTRPEDDSEDCSPIREVIRLCPQMKNFCPAPFENPQEPFNDFQALPEWNKEIRPPPEPELPDCDDPCGKNKPAIQEEVIEESPAAEEEVECVDEPEPEPDGNENESNDPDCNPLLDWPRLRPYEEICPEPFENPKEPFNDFVCDPCLRLDMTCQEKSECSGQDECGDQPQDSEDLPYCDEVENGEPVEEDEDDNAPADICPDPCPPADELDLPFCEEESEDPHEDEIDGSNEIMEEEELPYCEEDEDDLPFCDEIQDESQGDQGTVEHEDCSALTPQSCESDLCFCQQELEKIKHKLDCYKRKQRETEKQLEEARRLLSESNKSEAPADNRGDPQGQAAGMSAACFQKLITCQQKLCDYKTRFMMEKHKSQTEALRQQQRCCNEKLQCYQKALMEVQEKMKTIEKQQRSGREDCDVGESIGLQTPPTAQDKELKDCKECLAQVQEQLKWCQSKQEQIDCTQTWPPSSQTGTGSWVPGMLAPSSQPPPCCESLPGTPRPSVRTGTIPGQFPPPPPGSTAYQNIPPPGYGSMLPRVPPMSAPCAPAPGSFRPGNPQGLPSGPPPGSFRPGSPQGLPCGPPPGSFRPGSPQSYQCGPLPGSFRPGSPQGLPCGPPPGAFRPINPQGVPCGPPPGLFRPGNPQGLPYGPPPPPGSFRSGNPQGLPCGPPANSFARGGPQTSSYCSPQGVGGPIPPIAVPGYSPNNPPPGCGGSMGTSGPLPLPRGPPGTFLMPGGPPPGCPPYGSEIQGHPQGGAPPVGRAEAVIPNTSGPLKQTDLRSVAMNSSPPPSNPSEVSTADPKPGESCGDYAAKAMEKCAIPGAVAAMEKCDDDETAATEAALQKIREQFEAERKRKVKCKPRPQAVVVDEDDPCRQELKKCRSTLAEIKRKVAMWTGASPDDVPEETCNIQEGENCEEALKCCKGKVQLEEHRLRVAIHDRVMQNGPTAQPPPMPTENSEASDDSKEKSKIQNPFKASCQGYDSTSPSGQQCPPATGMGENCSDQYVRLPPPAPPCPPLNVQPLPLDGNDYSSNANQWQNQCFYDPCAQNEQSGQMYGQQQQFYPQDPMNIQNYWAQYSAEYCNPGPQANSWDSSYSQTPWQNLTSPQNEWNNRCVNGIEDLSTPPGRIKTPQFEPNANAECDGTQDSLSILPDDCDYSCEEGAERVKECFEKWDEKEKTEGSKVGEFDSSSGQCVDFDTSTPGKCPSLDEAALKKCPEILKRQKSTEECKKLLLEGKPQCDFTCFKKETREAEKKSFEWMHQNTCGCPNCSTSRLMQDMADDEDDDENQDPCRCSECGSRLDEYGCPIEDDDEEEAMTNPACMSEEDRCNAKVFQMENGKPVYEGGMCLTRASNFLWQSCGTAPECCMNPIRALGMNPEFHGLDPKERPERPKYTGGNDIDKTENYLWGRETPENKPVKVNKCVAKKKEKKC